jgi:hypothetical protein
MLIFFSEFFKFVLSSFGLESHKSIFPSALDRPSRIDQFAGMSPAPRTNSNPALMCRSSVPRKRPDGSLQTARINVGIGNMVP